MEYNGFPAVRGRGMVLTIVQYMSIDNVYNDRSFSFFVSL